jgi:hypothetical protein
MFYSEHNPPHFHAEYQGTEGIFNFEGEMTQGNIRSNTALRLIKEWSVLSKAELEENWKNITEKVALNRIEPLHYYFESCPQFTCHG